MKKSLISLICMLPLCSCGIGLGGGSDSAPVAEAREEGSVSIDAAGAYYRKISPEEAREMMLSGESYILLDVRTDTEYLENRIDGAILIPDYDVADRAEAELPDKDAVILIYCRSGRRSAIVARELAAIGYTNVYDFGGIIDWPFETTGG